MSGGAAGASCSTATPTPTPTPTPYATPNPAKCDDPTVTGKLHVMAEIDGNSQLIIQGNSIHWHHNSSAAPGRLGGHDYPTYVSCATWFPTWPSAGENLNCGCDSSVLHPSPPLPALSSFVGITPVNAGCRGTCTVLQAPAAANSYTLILGFDDPPGGSAWYEIYINFQPPGPHGGNIFPVAGGAPGPFVNPSGVVRAPDGSLYVSDSTRCIVMKVVPATGATTTVAGSEGSCGYSGDGNNATSAQLRGPAGLAFDSNGYLYIADPPSSTVRRVAPNGVIITVAGADMQVGSCMDGSSPIGPCLGGPTGVWVSNAGDLYIANFVPGGALYRVTNPGRPPDPGQPPAKIYIHAGNGTAGSCPDDTSATGGPCLNHPWDVVGDDAGNVYISNAFGRTVSKVSGGLITTVAGNGTSGNCSDGDSATGACLMGPAGLALDGSDLYIVDRGANRIKRVTGGFIYRAAGGGTPSPGFCGDFGPPLNACLNGPTGVTVGPGSRVYFADSGNARVRFVYGSTIDTVSGPDFCGDGRVAKTDSCLDQPSDVTMDGPGNIYIADPGNHRVREVDTAGQMSTLAGKTEQTGCVIDSQPATDVCLADPRGVTARSDGHVYISDRTGNVIWEYVSGAVIPVAGNGTAGSCPDDTSPLADCLNAPRGLAYYEYGGSRYLIVAQDNGTVLRIKLNAPAQVRTVFSDGNVATDVAVDRNTGAVYVAQPAQTRIVILPAGGDHIRDGSEGSATVAGGGGTPPADYLPAGAALFNAPSGVEVDGDGHLLISETGSHLLWVVTESGTVSIDGVGTETLYRIAGGGTPSPGFCGDPSGTPTPTPHNAREACLSSPGGLFYHDIGTDAQKQFALYFADTGNNRVRKIPSDSDTDGLTDQAEINGIPLKSGLNQWATPGPMTPTPVPGTVRTDPRNADTDGDGCTDAQEVGTDKTHGGRRDPTNFWDYFDTPDNNGVRDRRIRVDDVTRVVNRYLTTDDNDHDGVPDKNPNRYSDPLAVPPPVPPPAYSPAFDRTVLGPNVWNLGPPNGLINVSDVVAVVNQYRHDCA